MTIYTRNLILGIVLGLVLPLILILCFCFLYFRYKEHNSKQKQKGGNNNNINGSTGVPIFGANDPTAALATAPPLPTIPQSDSSSSDI